MLRRIVGQALRKRLRAFPEHPFAILARMTATLAVPRRSTRSLSQAVDDRAFGTVIAMAAV
ncbi:MAG: hypothetical protein ABI564_14655, partial [Ideonella sp.]